MIKVKFRTRFHFCILEILGATVGKMRNHRKFQFQQTTKINDDAVRLGKIVPCRTSLFLMVKR